MFCQAELALEQMEVLEPSEYSDRYVPNKLGLIFSERLFVGDLTFGSFSCALVRNEGAGQAAKNVKGAAESPDEPLLNERRVRMELHANDGLVCQVSGRNGCFFSNLTLPKGESEFFLKAFFDLREWPECQFAGEETQNIAWYLRVQAATNTVVLVKDTQKEERERAIQKSWEDKEAGRAERAKRARAKFLAKLKPAEELTPEEKEMLNEPRVFKKQQQQQDKKADKKGKAPPPGKKDVKKEEHVETNQTETFTPLSRDHTMEEIRSYLQKLESPTVKTELPKHGGEVNIRSS